MIPVRAAAAAAAALCAAGAAVRARGDAAPGAASAGIGEFGRYEIILDKTPFGAPPRTGGADAAAEAEAAASAAARAAAEAAANADAPVRMASVSRFGGVPAAGFVDVASGRQFLLRKGESCGGYELRDLDPDLGAALVGSGTNEWLVSISWAKGQATDFVPSSRMPYLTAFRPGAPEEGEEKAEGPAAESAAPGGGAGPGADAAAAAPAAKRRGGDAPVSTEISPEEEAELVARATVSDPDGGTHVSFRELNRLRAQLRRRKAEAAREAELAAYEAKAAAAEAVRAAEEARLAAEEAASSSKEKRRRAALISAIAQGYDVGEDVELTDEEAEELRQAGFQVPER